jgi:hypothetical protein
MKRWKFWLTMTRRVGQSAGVKGENVCVTNESWGSAFATSNQAVGKKGKSHRAIQSVSRHQNTVHICNF